VVDRCRGRPLSTTVVFVNEDHEERAMTTQFITHYTNPALDAELAYRREMLEIAARRSRTGRGRFFTSRRRNQI
jgi:hypothetical protein